MGVGAEPENRQEEEHPIVIEAIRVFRELREKIYSILPEDCLHKRRKTLGFQMVTTISPALLQKKLISTQDICAMCDIEICPWYGQVSHKWLRLLKNLFLSKIFGSHLKKILKAAKK